MAARGGQKPCQLVPGIQVKEQYPVYCLRLCQGPPIRSDVSVLRRRLSLHLLRRFLVYFHSKADCMPPQSRGGHGYGCVVIFSYCAVRLVLVGIHPSVLTMTATLFPHSNVSSSRSFFGDLLDTTDLVADATRSPFDWYTKSRAENHVAVITQKMHLWRPYVSVILVFERLYLS